MGDDAEFYQKLCRLRELFSGRYSVEETAAILGFNDNHLDRSVSFVLTNEPHVIRQKLETELNSWTTIESKTKRVKRARTIVDRAKSGQIDTTPRQFACRPCDSVWWRRTPSRKQVSRCNRCRKRYDAVPRDKEWGWAEFRCPYPGCGREFGGWCAMFMTCPCYGCGQPIRPIRVLPPKKDRERGNQRNTHTCSASDCCNRHNNRGPINPDPTIFCVHPRSLMLNGRPKVVSPSPNHDSTGSTVDTFLSQTELLKGQENIFYPSLNSIKEDDGSSGKAGPPSDSAGD